MLNSTHRFLILATVLAAGWLLGACGSRTQQELSPDLPAPECVVAGPPTLQGNDTVTVTVMERIDFAGAPVPHNESERLVYRHIYETLLRLDCHGRPVKGLAESWSTSEGGRRLGFVLASNATFWDGSPVTATDVVLSWRAHGHLEQLGILPDSVVVVSETELSVVLADPLPPAPGVFANQRLAIVKPSEESYVQGAGPYRVVEPDTQGGVLVAPTSMRSDPVIEFRVAPGMDARDVIDRGTDVLLTSDPRAIDYATGQSDFDAVPLPWVRSHVAVSPSGNVLDPGGAKTGLPEELREELARDVVRAEARSSQPPYWWQALNGCAVRQQVPETGRAQADRPPQVERIVYRRDDRVSRDIAERLVALATLQDNSQLLSQMGVSLDLVLRVVEQERLAATALSAEQFATSLRLGEDLLYIVGLKRFETDPCRAAQAWIAAAPWLAQSAPSMGSRSQVHLADQLVPLVDTRAHAIVRRDRVGLRLDWDGTVTLFGR
jgi:hypothetical protein